MSRLIYRTELGIFAACLALGTLLFFTVYQTRPVQAGKEEDKVQAWQTTADLSTHLAPQANKTFTTGSGSDATKITVDENQQYQQMDGFGASFTDSSAWLVSSKMDTKQRDTLMKNLFDAHQGIGLNFLRQPMGASDLTRPAPEVGEYSYDDMPQGQTDPNLDHFSIDHDTSYIIPVLQQALKENKDIKIMASPWSAPGWMKSSGSMEGGTLNSSAYTAYANYFVKFIQAYQAQGLPIYAVTPQNEPLYVPSGYPGMSFPAKDETTFIRDYLGPAMVSNGLSTKILGYDHNWDQPGYPTTILSDPGTTPYATGTAWHCYGGSVSAQTPIHNAYPDKDTYETDCSGGQWEGSNGFANTMDLLIGTTRNWSKSVVRWGMALDPDGKPNLGTGAACTQCRGIVTVDQTNGTVTYNGDYYGLGQASKFVQPGAYRVASSSGLNGIKDVAFKNADGSKVLVTYNSSSDPQTFDVQWGDKWFADTLPAGAATTFKWTGKQSTNNHSALNRTGWTTSTSATPASTDNSAANVLDDDYTTHWSSTENQTNGQWFQIDMGSTQTFSQMTLDAGSDGDYPHGYQVSVSDDGANWSNPVASGNGSAQQPLSISFAPQTARYIRIVQTGSADSKWSIYEMNVYP
ncbi:glucosylceramidase [Dictyobacter vulcani]|uniref:Glucosylceramidase n=1 Tax=Dictyobacter vulcani TaxID=2607529 RepID=A0A5J4KK08_9CHLR|nr:discoidin domain-containing protein [Dictyobacter vulcani]GER88093.1 glucosylceramidase [Dictyobacter vulcani]